MVSQTGFTRTSSSRYPEPKELSRMKEDALKPAWPTLIEKIRARTPARVLVERAGAAYRTETQLELREAHAAARDAVRTEFDLERDLGADLVREWKLFVVSTMAATKDEYLLRPDLGRQLDPEGRKMVLERCPLQPDFSPQQANTRRAGGP